MDSTSTLDPELIQAITRARELALKTQLNYSKLSRRLKELESSQDFSSITEPYPFPSFGKVPALITDYFSQLEKKNLSLLSRSDSSRSAIAVSSTSQLYHNLNILARLYVGSIPFELTDGDLKAAFSIFGPVKNISMTIDPETLSHKGFCFVEFETPDAASLAIETMNSGDFGGRALKVGRPMNFPTELPPGVPRPYPSRLYIASVSELITEADLREVFSAFGLVSSLSLIPDAHDKRRHRGYGYVEYTDSASARQAISNLKGFKLGGLELRVGKTTVGGPMPGGMDSVSIKSSSSLPSSTSTLKPEKKLPPAVLEALKGIEAAVSKKK